MVGPESDNGAREGARPTQNEREVVSKGLSPQGGSSTSIGENSGNAEAGAMPQIDSGTMKRKKIIRATR